MLVKETSETEKVKNIFLNMNIKLRFSIMIRFAVRKYPGLCHAVDRPVDGAESCFNCSPCYIMSTGLSPN
jgi:hypothetical protein